MDVSIKTYFGIEANIRGIDGQLDVKDSDRKKIDILLAGFHRGVKPAGIKSFFRFFLPNYFWAMLHWTPKGRIKKNTEIAKRAIQKHDIDIYAHPNRYFKVDVVEVAKVCAERKTLVELNGSRISFRPIDFERMLAVGAKFIINSDSHYAKRVGVVDRVYEFLKYCDFEEKDIINLTGSFRRPGTEPEKKPEDVIKKDAPKSKNAKSDTKGKKVAESKDKKKK